MVCGTQVSKRCVNGYVLCIIGTNHLDQTPTLINDPVENGGLFIY